MAVETVVGTEEEAAEAMAAVTMVAVAVDLAVDQVVVVDQAEIVAPMVAVEAVVDTVMSGCIRIGMISRSCIIFGPKFVIVSPFFPFLSYFLN